MAETRARLQLPTPRLRRRTVSLPTEPALEVSMESRPTSVIGAGEEGVLDSAIDEAG
jgi:hypothetical protein